MRPWISSAVMDVGQRLSMVCNGRSPSLRMVPPTTVSGPKYSSAVAMPTPAPVVSDTRLCTSSKNSRSCLVAQAVLQQVVRQQHDGGDATLGPGGMGIVHTRSIDARRAIAGVFHGNALGRGQRAASARTTAQASPGTALVTTPPGDVQNHRIGDGRARDAPVVAALSP